MTETVTQMQTAASSSCETGNTNISSEYLHTPPGLPASHPAFPVPPAVPKRPAPSRNSRGVKLFSLTGASSSSCSCAHAPSSNFPGASASSSNFSPVGPPQTFAPHPNLYAECEPNLHSGANAPTSNQTFVPTSSQQNQQDPWSREDPWMTWLSDNQGNWGNGREESGGRKDNAWSR